MRRTHRPRHPRRPATAVAAACALLLPALLCPLPLAAQELTPEPPPLVAPPEPAAATVPPPPPEAATESLPALLARVLATDPQVRVAQSLLQAADARRLQARSRLGPSAQLSVLNGQSRDREVLGVLDRKTDRVEAGLRWNLYNGGNDHAELRATRRDRDAAVQDLRRAREESCERITEPYVDLLRLQTLLPAAAERLTAVRRLAAQVQRQNEAGKASDADSAQATASLLDAEIVFEQLQADFLAAREKLAALAGTEVRAVLPVALPPAAMAVPAAAPAAQAAAADPAGTPGLVEAARLRAQAARERVRPQASVYAPRIDLEVRHQLSDRTTPAQTTEQQRSWMLTARWELPVMGELQARRDEAQRRAEAADAEADRIARGTRAELQTLGPRIGSAERALVQIDRQITQYDALLRAGEIQFEAGRRSVAQLIQLRDSRYNAEQRRAEQAQRLLSAQLRRLALTGQLLPALGLGGGADDAAD